MSSMIVILSDERSEESKDPYGSNEPTFFGTTLTRQKENGPEISPRPLTTIHLSLATIF